MNTDEYMKMVEESHQRRIGIMKSKRYDYAEDADALANFKRLGQAAKILRIHKLWETNPALAYALFMVIMKVDRIVNLTESGKTPKNEAIQDTWDDGVNYLQLAQAIYIDTKKGLNNAQENTTQ